MVDMFEIKMCNYCKNTKCNKTINITIDKGVTIYKCNEYIRDKKKISNYVSPEIITAKRKYIRLQER